MREIGRELGVSHVLEGGVQRAGDSVRIFVRLVEAASDTQIWTASYDAALEVAGLFAIQREIAESVAEALGAELTDAERARVARVPETDIEVLRHHMRGRQHWHRRTQEGMDSAIVHFQAALRRDSSFAPAYAGLANVYVLGHGPGGTDRLLPAVDAARSALRVDRDLAEAHASLGLALMLYEWNRPAADSAFRRAIDLDPSYATAHQWYAEFLASQGRLDEAIEQVRVAEILDPLSAIIGWNVSRILGFARHHAEELDQLRRQADLHPQDDRIITSLVWSLMGFGRNEEAAEIMEDFLTPMMQEAGSENADRFRFVLAGIRAGRAEALLTFFLESVPEGTTGGGHQRMFTAVRHAVSGELGIAIGIIEEAYRERAFGLLVPDLAVGAAFDVFRDDPRFQHVLRRMGLDPEIGIRLRNRDPRWVTQRSQVGGPLSFGAVPHPHRRPDPIRDGRDGERSPG